MSQAPAVAAYSASGDKDGTDSGKVTVVTEYQAFFGASVLAKKLGPNTNETYSYNLPQNDLALHVDWSVRYANVLPYQAAHWSSSSVGPAFSAHAQCSKQPAPTGEPGGWLQLGNKTCPKGTKVVIAGDGFGELWFMYIDKADGKVRRVHFPIGIARQLTINTLNTLTNSVTSAFVWAFDTGDAENAVTGESCNAGTRI